MDINKKSIIKKFLGLDEIDAFFKEKKHKEKIEINQKSIEEIIEEVAPRVKNLTGWNSNLDKLKVKVVEINKVWEEGPKQIYNILGIDIEPKTKKGKINLMLEEIFLPYLTIGQYEPITGTMLIVPNNFSPSTDKNGLATVLGHELMHHYQFSNNPKFTNMYSEMVKKLKGDNAFDENKNRDKKIGRYFQSYMTLIEGAARFIEIQLKDKFYKDGKVTGNITSDFMSLGLVLVSLGTGNLDVIKKMMQYEKGHKIVSKIHKAEGRSAVNDLYNLSIEDLYSKFK